MANHTIKDLKDLDPVLKNLDTFREKVPTEFRRAMQASVLIFEANVAERTPVGIGNSATGHLRVSIASEVRGTGADIHGEVFTPALHGMAVEFGTRPHFPPPEALHDWVRLKLGVPQDEVKSVAYLVARKIARRGTKGAFMFRDGWNASVGRVRDLFKRAMKSAKGHF